jgi:hypothetical protein
MVMGLIADSQAGGFGVLLPSITAKHAPGRHLIGIIASVWRTGEMELPGAIRGEPNPTSLLGGILDVEASHLALSKTENVSDHLVFKPVRLPLERFAFEIADGLPDFRDDRAIRSSMKAHRIDVRTDHGPLARPVLAYCFAPMNVATIHTVGPGDIIGEHGQHAVNVPRVEAIVDALEEFDIAVHCFSRCVRKLH